MQLFTFSRHVGTFFASRALEGIGVAAVTPPLLAYLAESTTHEAGLRARVMSYFELSLLAGLALGGLVGVNSGNAVHIGAFGLVAVAYLLCAILFLLADATARAAGGPRAALHGLVRAFSKISVRALHRSGFA